MFLSVSQALLFLWFTLINLHFGSLMDFRVASWTATLSFSVPAVILHFGFMRENANTAMFSIHVANTMIPYVRYNIAIIRSEFHKHNVASRYTRWIDEGVSRDNQKMVPSNTIKLLWRCAQLCSYIIPDNANLFKQLYPGSYTSFRTWA